MITKNYSHNRVKETRLVDKKFLTFVNSQPCCVNGCSKGGPAHHRLNTDSRRRFGKSHDREVVPLCVYHHAILHAKMGTDQEFEETHELDFEEVSARMIEYYYFF